MTTDTPAERLRLTDLYKRNFEHANTELAVRGLPLRNNTANVEQLRAFVSAGLKLATVCQQPYSQNDPIDVLLWLRERLSQETDKPLHDVMFKAACRREIDRVKHQLRAVYQITGQHNVVPFVMP